MARFLTYQTRLVRRSQDPQSLYLPIYSGISRHVLRLLNAKRSQNDLLHALKNLSTVPPGLSTTPTLCFQKQQINAPPIMEWLV